MKISVNSNQTKMRTLKLIFLIATMLLVIYHLKWNYIIIRWTPKNNDISCYYSFKNDSLPIFRKSAKKKSFFFHETSCRGGLNSRQACAVESAAKAHPDWSVHVLFSSPITLKVLQYSNLAVLRTYPNVILSRVDLEKHTDDEYPLGLLEALKMSPRAVEDTAELLKIMTLLRCGGVYLDLDVVVIRPFKNLSDNFVAKQYGNKLAFGVLALKNTGFGRSIAKRISNKLQTISKRPYLIKRWTAAFNRDASCHYSLGNDALPPFKEPKTKTIFFHETSCQCGLTSRQACAVESAAKAHPHWEVYLLFNSPVTQEVLKYTNLGILQEYPNIKIARVHMERYCKGVYPPSVLDALKKSMYAVNHSSDLLRVLSLYLWGGVYLDLDLVVVRPLDSFPPNWAAKQFGDEVAFGVVALSKDAQGSNMSKLLLTEISKNYDPYSMTSNGPDLISRALKKICPAAVLPAGRHCYGFYIYGPELFYPISYRWGMKYFYPGNLSDVDNGYEPYVHHMWNGLTWDLKVHKDSPYAKLAKQFCPRVFEMYGEEFGV